MAPAAPNEKRKRGRRPGGNGDALERVAAESASKQGSASEQNQGDGDADEDTRPKKRGRPRKSEDAINEAAQAEPEQEGPPSNARRSKRDRRSIDDNPYWISRPTAASDQQQNEEVADDAAPPKKRQRKAPVEGEEAAGAAEAAQPKRRGRPRTSLQAPEEATEVSQVAAQQSARRRKGAKRVVEEPVDESTAEPENQPRRRGRPSLSSREELQEVREEPGNRQAEKLSKGSKKPRLSKGSIAEEEPRQKAKTKPHPSKRPSTAPVVAQKRSAKSSSESNEKSTSRQKSVADGSIEEPAEELSDANPDAPNYRQLEPQPRQVSRSVISDKWTPLDEASIKAVSAILSDTTRLVLTQHQGPNERYQQTHEALNRLSVRVLRKLRDGLPFPPPTQKPTGRRSEGTSHVDEMNIESTVDSIEALQRTLNPLLDSIKLLEAEKRKEEAALKQDYRELTALETNAKAEARSWKENQRKKHPLVLTGDDKDGVDDENGLRLAKPRGDAALSGLFDDKADDEVVAMANQIANHMESMRNNLQPLQDILLAMNESKAAVQTVLLETLTAQQLERVLLG